MLSTFFLISSRVILLLETSVTGRQPRHLGPLMARRNLFDLRHDRQVIFTDDIGIWYYFGICC